MNLKQLMNENLEQNSKAYEDLVNKYFKMATDLGIQNDVNMFRQLAADLADIKKKEEERKKIQLSNPVSVPGTAPTSTSGIQ